MNKNIKNTQSGLYFVDGSGFVGNQNQATVFDSPEAVDAAVSAITRVGFGRNLSVVDAGDPNIVQNANGTSFAVSFIRPGDLDGYGGVRSNHRNPSVRRFRTQAEAVQHGTRFTAIEKHLGFYVTVTRDPVNAYINPATGKTNPEIGRARTNR